MKRSSVLFLILFGVASSLWSQSNIISENRAEKPFSFGIGFSEGFFYPGDVNDYIDFYTSYINITNGSSSLFVNYVGKASLIYRINKTVRLSLVGEYGWGPKYFVVSNGDNEYFHFDRASIGLVAKFHIPVGSGRHSIFIVPGLLYHSMKFEDFKANNIGGRLGGGFSFNFKKFKLQPFTCYDYVSASDTGYGFVFELNYSGIQFGVDFIF
jgi:hypothetical protein